MIENETRKEQFKFYRELSLLSTKPPRNALEEFILWTEQGKLWKFPIDNEQVSVLFCQYGIGLMNDCSKPILYQIIFTLDSDF